MQLDNGPCRLRRDAIDAADKGPAVSVGRTVNRMFGFGSGDMPELPNLLLWHIRIDHPPVIILPEDSNERTPPWDCHIVQFTN